MSNIEFRKLQRQDGAVFSHFLAEVFGGKPCDVKLYEYAHFDNPAGESIIYGAWDGEKLVGTQLSRKCFFLIDGKRTLFGHLGSTATHKDYRRQSIALRLNDLCREEAKKQGVSLSFGFPNENSIAIVVRSFGREKIGELPILIDAYRIREILKLKRPQYSSALCSILAAIPQCFVSARSAFLKKPKGNVQVNPVGQVDAGWDQLMERIAPEYRVIQERNAQFVRWRFLNHPIMKYKILEARRGDKLHGYLVYVVHPWPEREEHHIPCGYVVDFLVPKTEEGRNTLHHLLYCARREMIADGAVIGTSINNMPEHFNSVFYKAFFFIAPRRIMPRPFHFTIRDESEQDAFITKVKEMGNWYLTLADNDII